MQCIFFGTENMMLMFSPCRKLNQPHCKTWMQMTDLRMLMTISSCRWEYHLSKILGQVLITGSIGKQKVCAYISSFTQYNTSPLGYLVFLRVYIIWALLQVQMIILLQKTNLLHQLRKPGKKSKQSLN